MSLNAKKTAAVILVTSAFALMYGQVFRGLVHAWINDGNYSHGFLVVPIAGYLVWERRARLQALTPRPTWVGLVVLAAGLFVLLAGLYGSELFLSRVSMIGTLAGVILFLFGWTCLRIVMFPLAFLLLMIPLPTLIFNQIALPLQFFASRVGESVIAAAGIPVLREGNVLVLANTSLEVAEACSGIRSLVSLITLGLVYGYAVDPRSGVRAAIVLSTIPIAVLANGARVAGTGILAHYWGAEAAQGFFHEFSGWVVFVVAFIMILGVQRIIVRLAPRRRPSGGGGAPSFPLGEVVPVGRH